MASRQGSDRRAEAIIDCVLPSCLPVAQRRAIYYFCSYARQSVDFRCERDGNYAGAREIFFAHPAATLLDRGGECSSQQTSARIGQTQIDFTWQLSVGCLSEF